ncbi:MAG: ABC transporter ATP-binding protein [Bacillota bacterium]
MIKTTNLTKKFDEYKALDNLSCTIPEGCIYGLIGSNGAGKSTFFRTITGIYKQDSGEIQIDGKNVFNNPLAKSDFVFVPDDLYFLKSSSLNRMAKLYASVYKNFDKKRFSDLVDAFSLNPNKNIATFSKGMKRQAATILALSCKTKYLFFDETFDGLDPIMRNLVKTVVYQDVCDRGATAVISSHALRELEDTCDQLSLLYKGGILFESDVQNLKTSLFKVQVAFLEDFDEKMFADIEILSYNKLGRVANLIVKGDREQTKAKLQSKNPALLEILPLSLEEVFVHEMDALGYTFDTNLEVN